MNGGFCPSRFWRPLMKKLLIKLCMAAALLQAPVAAAETDTLTRTGGGSHHRHRRGGCRWWLWYPPGSRLPARSAGAMKASARSF
jgi:hypothetical protein